MPLSTCSFLFRHPYLQMLAWISGNLLFQQMPSLPTIHLLTVLSVLMIPAFMLPYWRTAGWLLLGFIWSFLRAIWLLPDPLPEALIQQPLRIEGQIQSIPALLEDGLRFRFQTRLQASDRHDSLVQLAWHHPPAGIRAGQYWTLEVRLKPPHGAANPGGYDQELQFYGQGIRATGQVVTRGMAVEHPDRESWCWQRVRQSLNDRIEAALGQRQATGLIQGLVLGATQRIQDEDWNILRITGTTHLIAISGSHIGLITLLVLKISQPVSGLRRYRHIPPFIPASLLACLAAIAYTALADWAVAAVRALIMCILLLFAVMLQRQCSMTRVLLQTLALVCLLQPLALLSPGCWLSFGAMVCLILPAGDRAGSSLLRDMLQSNWRCSLGLAPLLLYYFGQVSIISPLANLVAVPVIGMLLTPLALLCSLLLFPWPDAGAWGLFWIAQGLEWMMQGLQIMASWPWAQWLHARPPLPHTALATLGVLLWLLPRGFPCRYLTPLLCLPAMLWCPPRPYYGQYHATVLDVGQGLAMVIQTQQHVLVYDAGPRLSKASDSGLRVVIPFIRDQGHTAIDMMIISHHDNDHSGGAASVAATFPVSTLLAGEPEKLGMADSHPCRHDQGWIWDGVTFGVVWPETHDPKAKGNDRSCVLRVSAAQGSLLITGDIEKKAETAMVGTSGGRLDSDILIAPHHGSKTSSTVSLLDRVKPEWAIFSSGFLNHFHHPHPEVVQRYQQKNIHTLNTAVTGAVLIKPLSSGTQGFSILGQRELSPHYWYQGRRKMIAPP
ncbi:MAG: hypothetical protein RIQ52_1680 [Pseudomonadota bacterium]|jgi:competence protein ComEC